MKTVIAVGKRVDRGWWRIVCPRRTLYIPPYEPWPKTRP